MIKRVWKPFLALMGILLIFFSRFLPGIGGLSGDAMGVLGIFLGSVLLWLFIDIAWPSILTLLSLSLFKGIGTAGVISASFGNTTIWFLVFSFLMTFSLSETGFLRRAAMLFLNSRFAGRGPWAFVLMFLLAVLALGSFIAPTVTFLLFFALHREMMDAMGLKRGSSLARALMLGIACVTSISCAMTPIAHTFPLMALGFYEAATGETVSYFAYLKIGLPSGIILFLLAFLLLHLLYGRKVKAEKVNLAGLNLQPPQPIGARELYSALVFFTVVVLWLLSGVLPDSLRGLAGLGTVWPAMAGVVLLAAIPIRSKPALDIRKGMAQGVSWNSILLCSAALALGRYLTAEEYGITALIGGMLRPAMEGLGYVGALLVLIAATIVMTNFMSNIVTTTVMYNISAAVLPALALAGTFIQPQTAAILVGICASLAFATPPAIAHVALAAGSDWAGPRDVLIYGSILALLCIPVVLMFTLILH